jgi:hypothetical protein
MAEQARRQHPADCGCARCLGFGPGNDVAVRHGAYSLRLSEHEETQAFADFIRETQPVSHPADEGAVQRLADVYRRIDLSGRALDEADQKTAENPLAGYTDKAAWLGRLRDDHARWLREAGRIEAELGRTPASRAKLGLHLATARRAMTLADLHEQAALEVEVEEADDGE